VLEHLYRRNADLGTVVVDGAGFEEDDGLGVADDAELPTFAEGVALCGGQREADELDGAEAVLAAYPHTVEVDAASARAIASDLES
jgi:hypothetical protein